MFIIELLSHIFSMFTPSVWYVLIVCLTLVLLSCLAFLLSRQGERILTHIIKALELASSRKQQDAHIHIQISGPEHSCRDEHEPEHETLSYACQLRAQRAHLRRRRKKLQRQRQPIRRHSHNRYRCKPARRRVHSPKPIRKH